ncbi:MAG TPA: chemotaxis protein CheW [Noviherbaspirillum sp.]|nr:chemotaxis protein CheW [Noviherbaspirillum sp.]
MQFLVFHLGKDRYGLSTRHLTRVLPLMELKQLPGTPSHVAGLMNFHGAAVPVIDVCALACGTPCTLHFDTRILLVDYCVEEAVHMLGLIVERVAGVKDIDPGNCFEGGVSAVNAPFLGKVTASDGTILQLINAEHLLSPEVRSILFQGRSEVPR